ncbi:50S ribosomal protein L15 [bacterium]|jgi:large subunit ribosomal protein L15|nr:50S ribosomal protein L15 [bacterium]
MDKLELKPLKGAVKNRTRKGRGNSSGHGGECGRGHKGQRSRSGFSQMAGFEGGQMPLYRRIPKKNGFFNFNRTEVVSFNLEVISEICKKSNLNEIDLRDHLTKTQKLSGALVKVLGNGELTKGISITADRFSKTAIEKIGISKGKAEVIK